MWHHGWLLRRLLLISSVLTLSGLHVPGERSPTVWRAARLVPVCLTLTAVAANGISIAMSRKISIMLFSFVFAFVMWHMLCVLVHLLRHRRQMHRLIQRIERMEEATALCAQRGDHTMIRLRSVAIPGLTVITAVVWSSNFFANGIWVHPNYLFPIWTPVPLTSVTSFWVVVALEMVVVVLCFTLQVVFDLLLVGMMDGVALFQKRLTSLEDGLLQMAATHKALRCLASDAAGFCSALTLSQHASVTFQLLVGLYVTINMFASNYDRSLIITFVMFLATTVLRLFIVSATGSGLLASGERLSAALVTTRWSRANTASVRFTIQMLVEQTRKPLSFDGYGVFVTQKSTMLAMLSFVLTYFVIMVQMKV